MQLRLDKKGIKMSGNNNDGGTRKLADESAVLGVRDQLFASWMDTPNIKASSGKAVGSPDRTVIGHNRSRSTVEPTLKKANYLVRTRRENREARSKRDEGEINPYSTPIAPEETPLEDSPDEYPGIGRLMYCACFLALVVFVVHIDSFILSRGRLILLHGVVRLTLLYVHYSRLKNIGMHPLWCLAGLIPYVDFLLVARCAITPQGYVDSRKFDTAAKVVMGLIIALALLGPALIILWLWSSP